MNRLASTSPLFFFNDTATTEIYTLSLHDALPIFITITSLAARRSRTRARRSSRTRTSRRILRRSAIRTPCCRTRALTATRDRKSTRLNSSHLVISYAVFCLKKKNYREFPQLYDQH